MKKFTFGPVPSRRLGFSLGIDIIPLKTCTYNCVYCQLFQTSKHTIIRQSFIEKELVLNDIKESIDKFPNIDFLTFSGSGEPTLNSDLGWFIQEVKKYSNIPVAVITNSSLLWMADVIEDLKHADLVVPSVDCVAEAIWQKVNRPAEGIELGRILEGTKNFCINHKGTIWLEIMLVQGINDDIDEIKKVAKFVNSLKINKVQINTVVRPPNEIYAKPLSKDYLENILELFNHETEIIAPFNKVADFNKAEDKSELVLEMLMRRPCRPNEMADSLGMNLNELNKLIQNLESEKKIMRENSDYYSIYH